MASDETVRRAAPVKAPEPTRALQRERDAQATYREERAAVERRGMMRGLLLLALVVLLLSIGRAGLERVFVHGWWRHW
jgi:hypothetical protein